MKRGPFGWLLTALTVLEVVSFSIWLFFYNKGMFYKALTVGLVYLGLCLVLLFFAWGFNKIAKNEEKLVERRARK